jgi:ribosome assembly protein RRB1
MPKRAAPQDAQDQDGPYAKAPAGGAKRAPAAADEMGEFEDAWEDELESDEDAVDGGGSEDGARARLFYYARAGGD